MATVLKTEEATPTAKDMITKPYPKFQKLGNIPWKPWVMVGVHYKLLSVDKRTGGFTCMLKVEAGVEAPIHQHLGGIEIIVMEGDICYEDADIGQPGDYMYEPAGDIHQPISYNGCILFTVFSGPLAGLNDDGSVAGILDGKTMIQMATEHGVVDHVHQ
ncbi:MAG: 2,4'-dihydroxyacetophenone dioxygenase family protein [Pseudomonadota bacterium]